MEEVYPTWPAQPSVTVEPGPLATVLEGRVRPGHFRGVLTVVAKLFGLVRPDVAVFGQKDYQQLVLIRQMVADLCLPVEIVGAETQREPDGLALSSRNRYLDDDQRLEAIVLHRALLRAQEAAAYGAESALGAARAELAHGHQGRPRLPRGHRRPTWASCPPTCPTAPRPGCSSPPASAAPG